MTETIYVPRPEQAAQIAKFVSPDPIFGEPAGLFLAAPRRTGKSTFLRRDLTPHLEEQGYLVLYVDLWKDRSGDPADLISACIADAMKTHESAISKIKSKIPFTRVGALGITVDLKATGTWSGTLPDALSLLIEASGKKIVLIIDEAQQALESDLGKNTMYALKAARDQINQENDETSLFLIMTGSHRDKLASLVHDQKAPFFGARVRDFPKIGNHFSDEMSALINQRLSAPHHLSSDAVETAFDRLGRRPEMLYDCLRELLLIPEGPSDAALLEMVETRKADMAKAVLAEIMSLSAIQLRVLKMIAGTPDASLFSKESKAALGVGKKPASIGSIQNAIKALRERGFVWHPGHGKYIIENKDIMDAMASLMETEDDG